MTCPEARRLLPQLVAMELAPATEAELREHLAVCPGCRRAAAAREPVLTLAAALANVAGREDEGFAGEVMAQIHQRRLERRLAGRRARLVAAAAVTVALLGGATVVRELARPSQPMVAQAPRAAVQPEAAVNEPAFVEVDNAGVRLYQLSPASQSRPAVQVAFIVDPHLEL